MIMFVRGKDFRPGDRLMSVKSELGATVLDFVRCDTATLPQECWYCVEPPYWSKEVDYSHITVPYYSEQLYKIWRSEDYVGGRFEHIMSKDKVYEGKHRGRDEDSQARADALNALPTYQPTTPASKATAQPAQWEYDGRTDDLNNESDQG